MSRILGVMMIPAMLLPAAVVTGPASASTQAESTVSAARDSQQPFHAAPAAEAQKSKKDRKNKPRFKTVTRTIRQPVTRTFSNPTPIDVPNDASSSEVTANPYPSLITVAGLINGTILDVNLVLHGFTWDFPSDANILLVAPGQPNINAIVLSDVGTASGDSSQFAVSNLTLTLDDEASSAPPAPLVTGAFRPTNEVFADTFPAPAPTPLNNSALSVFDGRNPNGTWQVFVVDDSGDEAPGSLSQGWSLQITAEVDVQIQERVKTQKDKKRKRG